ncbi:UDP-GlcNAc betaGal beta-1,3-N-acetylglucosaminyltransferase 7 [Dermatophagoides pteronyssinus]|uniref:Hexosyltransferase n=1 Tax=Dermatophagoides pteronyssinus TaxID=6956 RepID=A0ABQ8J494_DERPT|nr:UDP-GlcNAc betaGal beta-1,3-N-acetylglucosaminyltransferase 7 [Dermatophagoides pteronyssinus]
MPRFPRFTYRFIRFIIIFIIIFSLFIICFYSYHWYDLEMVQKNYVKQIIKLSITNDHDQQQSLLTLNIDDIHRNLIKIYHQQPQQTNRLSPSAIDQYWSMAKNFNLTEENFGEWKKSFTGGGDDVRIRQDFPQSFFGTILGYHLKIASSLDQILRLNYPENLTIDKLIDERRQQGWITNLKLNEFQPITFLNFGAKICESKSLGFDLEALIFVITAPDDFELRSVIRQTWARKFQENSRQIRLYFAIGYSRYSQHHQQLQIEQEYYQYYDLIQWPFIENYNRLSIKSMALIRWSAIYCPMVKNIYKIDGDSLVNYDNFMKFIMKINNDNDNERQTKTTNVNTLKLSAYGNIRYPQAIRFWSKFATSFDDYPYVYYPKYTDASWMLSGGPGNSLLTYATGILETMPALPWEDVLITGLIPQRMQNNHHIDYKHYYFPGYNDRIKINEIDNCKFQMSIIFTHKFNQYNLQKIWNKLQTNFTKNTNCQFLL